MTSTASEPAWEKRVALSDWATLEAHAPTRVKAGSTGAIGAQDRKSLETQLGEHSLKFVKDALAKLRPGEVPVFSIALGSYEVFGTNRNHDAFGKKACRDYHDTFVKIGRWFRDHNNKPTSPFYGRHVASTFNEKLGRVEVLTGLFSTKAAAEAVCEKFGRIADLELDALESNRPIATSMSCRIDVDVCSSCGNEAKSPKHYCDETTCKHGGCKKNLGRLSEDGHLLHVDNPRPQWFDLSNITNLKQADRIAYTYGVVRDDDVSPEVKKAYQAVRDTEARLLLSQPLSVSDMDAIVFKTAARRNPVSVNFGFGGAIYASGNTAYEREMLIHAEREYRRLQQQKSASFFAFSNVKSAFLMSAAAAEPTRVSRHISGLPSAESTGCMLAQVAASSDIGYAADLAVRLNSCRAG
jgi:hypothetical protein